jgi:lysozyme family protein
MRDTSVEYYQRLWEDMVTAPTWRTRIEAEGSRWLQHKTLYEGYQDASGVYVPWWLVAAMHDQEASNNPACQIWNGERWDQKTTLVPIGKGPWASFRASTEEFFAGTPLDLTRIGAGGAPVFSLPATLQVLERHNGLGYAKKGKHTPYLWTGTQYGVGTGLYVADGKYSATAEAKQAGLAPTLYWVLNGRHAGFRRGLTGDAVLAAQKFLNTLGCDLKEDGICGPVTLAALAGLQG